MPGLNAKRGTPAAAVNDGAMDRVVLVVGAVLAAVLCSGAVLWMLHDYAMPVFVNGEAMARRVDADAGNMIAARFAGVQVGLAQCPRIVNLTAHRTGRCVIPVAGESLPVDVAMGPKFRTVDVTPVDVLVVSRDAEQSIAARLEWIYGERFDVRCPGPAVRVLAPNTPITCTVEAADVSRRVEAHPRGSSGGIYPDPILGIATRMARIFGLGVARRTEGSVVLPGHALEQYVVGSAAAEAGGEVGRRNLLRTAHCPARVVLHEGSHASCTVGIAGLVQRYDVHFEKGLGLRLDTEHDVAVIPALSERATRYFERPAFTSGKPLHVHVDCGNAPAVFVEPGSSLPCTANIGERTIDFEIRVLDPEGNVTIVPGAR